MVSINMNQSQQVQAARICTSSGIIIVPDDGVRLAGLLPGCPGATLVGVPTGGCAEGPVAGNAQIYKS